MSKTNKILLVLLVIIICVGLYFVVTSGLSKNNNIAKKDKEDEEVNSTKPLYTEEDFPKIDSSLATQPLTDAIYEDFVGKTAKGKIDYSSTHQGYVKLINDEVDLIIVTQPSEEELELAKENGVELEVVPVVKEGFVFYVNSKNKVDNLTTEQIRKIYTGEIKNWKDVGGIDASIIPYQRPANSSSQTGMLSLVMDGYELMEAPKEKLIDKTQSIINNVSSYENGRNSIGYSYYYYAITMFQAIDANVASNIKLLSIDGVKPNNQTIKTDKYPFTTEYYIVINKADEEDSVSRKLAKQLLSTRGQSVAEKAGYVPVK